MSYTHVEIGGVRYTIYATNEYLNSDEKAMQRMWNLDKGMLIDFGTNYTYRLVIIGSKGEQIVTEHERESVVFT